MVEHTTHPIVPANRYTTLDEATFLDEEFRGGAGWFAGVHGEIRLLTLSFLTAVVLFAGLRGLGLHITAYLFVSVASASLYTMLYWRRWAESRVWFYATPDEVNLSMESLMLFLFFVGVFIGSALLYAFVLFLAERAYMLQGARGVVLLFVDAVAMAGAIVFHLRTRPQRLPAP